MNKQEFLNVEFSKYLDNGMLSKAQAILEDPNCSEEAFLGAKAVLMLHGLI